MNVNALAMIQPWHPAMMYLIYCAVSEEDMLEHRVKNQPIPAGRLALNLVPREALVEVHVTLCIYTKVQHCGIACHTVHLHKHPCASIFVLFRASRPSRARATLRAWDRFADPLGCVPYPWRRQQRGRLRGAAAACSRRWGGSAGGGHAANL